MADDLIDRFAARWGADARAMRSPPESHVNYPITGGEGLNPGEYAGEIQAIRLLFCGRWGNYVFQLMNLFHVAETLGATDVRIIETDVFPVRETVINGITIAPHEIPVDPSLYCLCGVFFSCTPLGGMMDDLTAERRVYLLETYIRPLLIPLRLPADIIAPGDLVIHIRSGDIFQGEEGQGGVNGGGQVYTQPPLSFYQMVVEHVFQGFKGSVFIISENSLNPVILPLVKMLDEAGHAVTLRLNQDLVTDLSWIFAAKNVVFANGSIGIAAALLSPSIRRAFFFRLDGTGTIEPVSKYIGNQIEKYFIVDIDQNYIPFGAWMNTSAQRHKMLDFPIQNLQWHDSPATLTNIALNKPASMSSVSIWSNPDDAQGGNNGNIDGGFGFHTDHEPAPWWQVDLLEIHSINEVRIFNRVNQCSERARSLKVMLSLDGIAWETVHDQGGNNFGGFDGRPLRVLLPQTLARYIRLQLSEANYFHLDEVEVY
jgi:hypothetical protein